jgi:hypothetical protein
MAGKTSFAAGAQAAHAAREALRRMQRLGLRGREIGPVRLVSRSAARFVSPPEVSPMKNCWPWNHQWSKWKDIQSKEVQRKYTDAETFKESSPQIVGHFIEQERRCERCGMVQLRRETVLLTV